METDRRGFLGASATAVASFMIVSPRVLGGPRHVAPSDTVNVALVGAGGQGRSNLRELFKLPDVRVVALADPAERWDLNSFYYKGDSGRLPVVAEIEKTHGEKSPGFRCQGYDDFRVLLEKEKSVDAVLCATPDHLHAYVSIHSMKAGKHVYCEKPLNHNIAEARRVAAVAAEMKVATQMGNQGHATEGIRQTVEWIHAGAVGTVTEVHAWVGTTRWNPTLQGRPTESMSVPAGLNWDLWLGPRESRPFHRAYAPVAWRDFWAFGCGALGDFGCHDLDSATWALDLQFPVRVEGSTAGHTDSEICPYGSIVRYRFGPRGNAPGVLITWYDGGLKPPTPESLPAGMNLPNRGVLFVGDRGVMLCGGAGGPPRLFPSDRDGSFRRPEPTIRRVKSHHRDWVDGIKGGPTPASNFAYGARLTEIVLLGVAALRTGKPIDWDPTALKARGNPAADAVIHESYRKGWELG